MLLQRWSQTTNPIKGNDVSRIIPINIGAKSHASKIKLLDTPSFAFKVGAQDRVNLITKTISKTAAGIQPFAFLYSISTKDIHSDHVKSHFKTNNKA